MQVAKGIINIPSQYTNTRFIVFTSKRAEISNVIQGSKILSPGRSYAASVPSDPSDVPKATSGSKRVSKLERKVKVEAFVNMYRAANAGKFPTASNTQNQVGGSYYIVKKFIQEIEYNSRISPSGNRNGQISTKESTKKNEYVAETEKATAPLRLQRKFQTVPGLEINDASDNISETNEELQSTLVQKYLDAKSQATVNVSLESNSASDNRPETIQRSTLVEKHFSEDVAKSQATVNRTSFDRVTTENHLHNGQTNEVSIKVMESLKHGKKEETCAENLQDFEDTKTDTQQLEGDKLSVDVSKEHSNGKEVQQKTNLWGNLKSLADGFMNMWKKL